MRPSLFTRIFKWETLVNRAHADMFERATQPISFTQENQRNGVGTQNQPGHAVLLRASGSWASTATRAIANRLASLTPKVVRIGPDGEEEDLEQHPLSAVLGRPNPMHSKQQTLNLIANHMVTVGEAYQLKVMGQGAPVPTELWMMDPASVRPVIRSGRPVSYEVRDGDGGVSQVPIEEVVRIWTPDPENFYTAEGVLNTQRVVFDANTFAEQTVREHFKNNATPSIIIERDKESGSLDPDELTRWQELWTQAYNSIRGTKRGLPAWLPQGAKARELAAMQDLSKMVPLIQEQMKQIMMAYGTPRSVVGDVADANRSNMEASQYGFDLYTISPLASLIEDAWTFQVAADYGEDIAVRFEEFIPRDKEFELKAEESKLATKQKSINMLLEEKGLDPVSWGDLPVGAVADRPYDGIVREIDAAQAQKIIDDPQGSSDDRKLKAWVLQREVDRERRFVPKAQDAMRRILERQKKEIIEGLQKRGLERGNRALTEQEIVEILRAILGGRAAFKDLFDLTFEPIRLEAFLASARDALRSVKSTREFVFSAALRMVLESQAQEFRRLVNNTTLKRLSASIFEVMDQSIAAGESTEQQANRIIESVRGEMDLQKNRALTIARTETLYATTVAQLESFEQSGVVERKTMEYEPRREGTRRA